MSKQYAVMDVETTELKHGEEPKTLFWGYADSDGYKRFETTEQFCNFLDKQPPKILLHHTNFDILMMLKDGMRRMQFVRTHNGKFIVTSLQKKHTCVNTYCTFPVKLEEIIKIYGYKKVSLNDLAARNYGDCVHALDSFLRLDSEFEMLLGQSPLRRHTIAATSFAAAEKEAGKLEKDLRFLRAYRGGRCDVFDTRQQISARFDINSSYPFSFIDAPEKSNLLRVRVKTNDWHGPLADCNIDQRLLFPYGEFESYVYEDVLEKYIIPNCKIKSLTILEKTPIDLSWLKRVVPVIMKLYNLKLNSPKGGGSYWVAKFGLNAMYGRMGLKGEREICQLLRYFPDKDAVLCFPLDDISFLAFYKTQTEPRSNYPLAAYITDNARGRVFEGIKKGQAIYTDTDSIDCLTGNPRQTSMGCGKLIGQWAFDSIAPFTACNLKDYYRGWNFKDPERNHHVKGGLFHINYSTKKLAEGKPAEVVLKTFSKELKKRILNHDGTTDPIKAYCN